MSKMKKQGTAHESWLVNQLTDRGIKASRLPEGGALDEGDVEAYILGKRWVFEAKARTNLNVQQTLGKARAKAGGLTPVAVVWKRLVKVAGFTNRQPIEGERVVVSLSLEDFLNIIDTRKEHDEQNTI